MDRRRSRRVILAAACAALVLRLGFALLYWTDKPLTHDEREYLALAANLSAGKGFAYSADVEGTSPRFGRAPGYPAFLALVGVKTGTGVALAHVKIVQAILGAFSVLLLASVARWAAGERTAAICACVAAIYPPLVTMPAYIFSEALYLPLALSCVLLLTMTPAESGNAMPPTRRLAGVRLHPAVTAGLAAGAGTLVRPGMLVFLPLSVVWLARRTRVSLAISFVLAAALVIAPWTARNVRHYGRFVLIASEGGVTFWTGNHPLARGEGDLAANPELKRAEIAFRAGRPGMTAEQLEPLYYRDAVDQIRSNPGWWLALLARKAFYTVVPIGPSYTLHSTKYMVTSVVPYAMLTPLAVAGFIVIRRFGRPPVPLYLLAASVVLTSLIFFPQERFRLTVIDPVVILAAAAALDRATRPVS